MQPTINASLTCCCYVCLQRFKAWKVETMATSAVNVEESWSKLNQMQEGDYLITPVTYVHALWHSDGVAGEWCCLSCWFITCDLIIWFNAQYLCLKYLCQINWEFTACHFSPLFESVVKVLNKLCLPLC